MFSPFRELAVELIKPAVNRNGVLGKEKELTGTTYQLLRNMEERVIIKLMEIKAYCWRTTYALRKDNECLRVS